MKKTIAALLTGIMMIGLTACGSEPAANDAGQAAATPDTVGSSRR